MWAAKVLFLFFFASKVTSQNLGPNCTNCSSAKALPCSGAISKALVESAITFLSATAEDANDAFTVITADAQFKKTGGFYVFVYDYDGPCVAHGKVNNFVGLTVPQVMAAINNPTDGQMIDDAVQAGAEAGGGWVSYQWKSSPTDPPYRKIAYVDKLTKWGKNYYVGVGYDDKSDPLDVSCATSGAAACAEINTLTIMGSLMASLTVATNITTVFEQITNKTGFRTDNGFYAYVYEYSGDCVAHGARSDFVGRTVPEIMALINNPTDGQMVDDRAQAGAEQGGAWVTYEWKDNSGAEPYQKIAYIMKFSRDGTDYYYGVGYNNVCMPDLAPGQELQSCTGAAPACDSNDISAAAKITCTWILLVLVGLKV